MEEALAKRPLKFDPNFCPFILALHQYAGKNSNAKICVGVALEREDGLISRHDLQLDPVNSKVNLELLERHLKFLLWAKGGWKFYLSGPQPLIDKMKSAYSASGARRFDVLMMEKVYGQPFSVESVPYNQMPEGRNRGVSTGHHLDGCRIGFDLGASDYKVAAVIDGNAVYSEEIPWNPSKESNPQYHYDKIMEGLKKAAAHMPRVDAIGGSSAGIYLNNQVKVASLFRSVPEPEFSTQVKPIFTRIAAEWKVPFVVINDGDVTALAGAMSLKKNSVLGIAMGSSEAVGYIDPKGGVTGCLNELAFAPVDLSPSAAVDEWSEDRGVGALYFSQQAVNKLALNAQMEFPREMALPERLKEVQRMARAGDPKALEIFSTIGSYLGYSIPLYCHYYDVENVLILGRVTSDVGGEVIIKKAQQILKQEFPAIAGQVNLMIPDEKARRVGQAVAAASLPELKT